MTTPSGPLSRAEQLFLELVYEQGKSLDETAEILAWGSGVIRRRQRLILLKVSKLADEGRYELSNDRLKADIKEAEFSFTGLRPGARWLMEKHYESNWAFSRIAEHRGRPEWVVRQCHSSTVGRLAEMVVDGQISPKIPKLLDALAAREPPSDDELSEDMVERWLDPRLAEVPIGNLILDGQPLRQMEEEWRSTIPICKTHIERQLGPNDEEIGFGWNKTVYVRSEGGAFRRVSGGPAYRTVANEGRAREELHFEVDEYARRVYLRLLLAHAVQGERPDLFVMPQAKIGLEILPQLLGGHWFLGRVWVRFESGIVPVAEFTDSEAAVRMSSMLGGLVQGPDTRPDLASTNLRREMLEMSHDPGSEASVDSDPPKPVQSEEVATRKTSTSNASGSADKTSAQAQAQGPMQEYGSRARSDKHGDEGSKATEIVRGISTGLAVAGVGYFAVASLLGPRAGNLAIPVLFVLGLVLATRASGD